jgi:glycosyltransferase involved in cell wall biosynthesis
MRVLHLAAGNLYGGIETQLATLARYYARFPEIQPVFGLCFRGRVFDELTATGANVVDFGSLRLRYPWTVLRARRHLRRWLKDNRVDRVICHSCWSNILFAPVVRRAGVPLVFSAHDTADGKHWLQRLARRYPPDLVLANSRFTEKTVPLLFPDVPSRVIQYPVVPPVTSNGRADVRLKVRQALEAPADAVVILQVSRMEAWKGHRLMLDALARLATEPGWVCWIAGGAQRPQEIAYMRELQERVGKLGLSERLRFLGQRRDVPDLLVAADIFCQPNLGPEPFGIVFVEALYAGLPVVTTALGGPLEIVTESCGALVPPGDVTALANALGELVRDQPRRQALGSAGPARAQELCDPDRQIRRLFDALQSVEVGPSGCGGTRTNGH